MRRGRETRLVDLESPHTLKRLIPKCVITKDRSPRSGEHKNAILSSSRKSAPKHRIIDVKKTAFPSSHVDKS